MFNVVVALMPATLFGIYHFGLHAALIVLSSVLTAVITELLFNLITRRPNSIKDCSAIVTGLLLALSLSPSVPLYIPVLGSAFAILFVKCFFGGLGKNFMNPALAGRCFLLLSFGTTMTTFKVDGITSATPLAAMRDGVFENVGQIFLGYSNSVIGGSALALLIGGLYLLATKGITIEIPAACILSFSAFIAIFGGVGLNLPVLLTHIFAGGILMGAFFMATDPVTSPMTSRGQILFGIAVGLLAGLFRIKGSAADSVSYAIIISNMLVPFIDKLPIPKPLGYNDGEYKKPEFPKSAVNLTIITLIAGLALSSVYLLTKDAIEEQQLAANAASYKEVCPDAEEFVHEEALDTAVAALADTIYSEEFGKTYINDMIVGMTSDGSVAGYVISVTSADGFDGAITLSAGISADGTLLGIAFTELNETAGMGMKVDEADFKDQFAGISTDSFTLNKAGGSVADNEIDSVTGASISSGAVVNAVNTALAFFAETIQ